MANILIVDEHPFHVMDIINILSERGHVVYEAVQTVPEAAARIKKLNPDLILLNIAMADKAGLIKASGSEEANLDIPIVLIASLEDLDILKSAARDDALGYILKPFRRQDVIVAVETALASASRTLEKKGESLEGREEVGRKTAILSALPDLFFLIDRDACFIDFHSSSEDKFLIPPREFLGKPVGEVLPSQLAEWTREGLELTLSGQDHDAITYRLEFKGEQGYYEARMARCGTDQALVIVRDVTEQVLKEAELMEREESIRRKLNVIMEPDSDMGLVELRDVIETKAIQALLDDFSNLTHISMAILDLSGKVLAAAGLQDICTKFHRINPETTRNCLESDRFFSQDVTPGHFKLYKCKNNMWDMATPIMVDGRRVGTLFLGQFFFEDEIPDLELFRGQARRYGFDEERYIEALGKVPKWSKATVESAMSFFTKFADILASLSHDSLKLARALSEKDRLLERLHQSEELYRLLVETSNDIIWTFDLKTMQYSFSSNALKRILGYDPEEASGKKLHDAFPPEIQRVVEKSFGKVLRGEVEADRILLEADHLDVTGRRIPLEINAILRRDENGTPTAFFGSSRDIRERKRQDALQAARLRLVEYAQNHTSEELARRLVDETEAVTGSKIGFYDFLEDNQKDLSFQTWSTNTLAICKADPGQYTFSLSQAGVWGDCVRTKSPVIHNDLTSLRGFPKGHPDMVRELVVPVIRGEKIVAILGVGNRPNPYNEEDAQIVQQLADLGWEIIASKKNLEALRASEARFRKLYEEAPVGIFRTNSDGKTLAVNTAMAKIVDLDTPEETVAYYNHLPSQFYVNPESRWIYRERLLRDGFVNNFEYEAYTAKKRKIWISVNARLARLDEDGFFIVEGFVTAIDDRKKAELFLAARNRELEALHRISEIALGARPLPDLLKEITLEVAEATGFSTVGIEFYDAQNQEMVIAASHGMGLPEDPAGFRVPVEQTLSGVAALTGRPLVETDALNRREYANRRLRSLKTQTFVCAPMMVGSRVIGVLSLGKLEKINQEERIVALASSLANFIAAIVENKKMEEALKVSQDNLSSLIENIDGSIWSVDRNMRLIIGNSIFHRFVAQHKPGGFQTGDHLLSGPYPQDFLDQWRKYYDRALSGERFSVEIQTFLPSDPQEEMEFSFNPILSDGEVTGATIFGRDITDRKRAEKALRENEEQYRTLTENIPGVVYRIHVQDDNRMQFFNDMLMPMTGCSQQELTCGHLCRIESRILSEDRDNVMETIKKACEGGRPFEVDYRFEHKDGGVRVFQEFGRPVFDSNARLLYIDGVILDVTERHAVEEALRKSEEKFSTAFMTSPFALLIVRQEDGVLLEVNDAFTEITGYGREEAVGLSFQGVNLWVDQDDRSRVIEALRKGEKVEGREYRFKRKNGEIMTGRFSAQFIDINGQKCLFSSVNDITAIKKAEEEKNRLQVQLQQSQKLEAVGTLAGGVSHDFNNLLQAISGYTQLILLSKSQGDPDYDKLQAIQKASDRAADLIRQLLLFSRKAGMERKAVNLNKEIEQAHAILGRTIPKMIDIRVHLDGRLWYVNADPAQMEQIILNLGSNAADAMPDGGSLALETSNIVLSEQDALTSLGAEPGRYVMLTVSDTGYGMDKETRAKIFEPFFTTKGIGKGTGLGLASVYGIVKGHGGYITCESEHGKGTAFKIYLPALEKEPEEQITDPEESPLPRGNETVLLVDDEDYIRDIARNILEQFGYRVLSAASGEEALEVYSQNLDKIRLVLLDIGMPGMGGHKCLMEIKNLNPKARIIVASGYSIEGKAASSMEAGASGYIAKPYQMKLLLEKIREVLDE